METTNARGEGEKYKSVENMVGSKDFKNSGTKIKEVKYKSHKNDQSLLSKAVVKIAFA